AECARGSTADACQRAGQKKCALYDGERCRDVALVHTIIARMLRDHAPDSAARHRVEAKDHARKACDYGLALACEGVLTKTRPLPGPVTPPAVPPPPTRANPFSQPHAAAAPRIVPTRALEVLRLRGTKVIDPPA